MTDQEITRIAQDTEKKLGLAKNKMTMSAAAPRCEYSGILVLVPENTCFPKDSALKRMSGSGQAVVAGYRQRSPGGRQYLNLEDGQCALSLIDSLESFEAVYLYSPGFELMERLTHLSDDDLVVRILMQALLFGKKAGVCFDHDIDSLPPGIVRRLRELMGEMENLGLYICNGSEPAAVKKECSETSRELLLEDDIIAMHRQGQTTLSVGQNYLFTPLAADKARELGIQLTVE